MVHRGRVTEQVPECGSFWVMDELTGGRHLPAKADLEIGRAPTGTAPRERAGSAGSGTVIS